VLTFQFQLIILFKLSVTDIEIFIFSDFIDTCIIAYSSLKVLVYVGHVFL